MRLIWEKKMEFNKRRGPGAFICVSAGKEIYEKEKQ